MIHLNCTIIILIRNKNLIILLVNKKDVNAHKIIIIQTQPRYLLTSTKSILFYRQVVELGIHVSFLKILVTRAVCTCRDIIQLLHRNKSNGAMKVHFKLKRINFCAGCSQIHVCACLLSDKTRTFLVCQPVGSNFNFGKKIYIFFNVNISNITRLKYHTYI